MKIFCIGRNKTGTTSLERALADFGYQLGDQAEGERLVDQYLSHDWSAILEFCGTAEAFQDAPFSWPFTWAYLAEHYPDASFILTVRESEKWYQSLVRYHTKLFSSDGSAPTKADLERATYRYSGFMWKANRAIWNTPENDVYNKQSLIENYEAHNWSVRHYFRDASNFLELDVSKAGSYQRLCRFLRKDPLYLEFPHLNRSDLE